MLRGGRLWVVIAQGRKSWKFPFRSFNVGCIWALWHRILDGLISIKSLRTLTLTSFQQYIPESRTLSSRQRRFSSYIIYRSTNGQNSRYRFLMCAGYMYVLSPLIPPHSLSPFLSSSFLKSLLPSLSILLFALYSCLSSLTTHTYITNITNKMITNISPLSLLPAY